MWKSQPCEDSHLKAAVCCIYEWGVADLSEDQQCTHLMTLPDTQTHNDLNLTWPHKHFICITLFVLKDPQKLTWFELLSPATHNTRATALNYSHFPISMNGQWVRQMVKTMIEKLGGQGQKFAILLAHFLLILMRSTSRSTQHAGAYETLLQARWRAVLLLTSTRLRSGLALCNNSSEMQRKRQNIFVLFFSSCMRKNFIQSQSEDFSEVRDGQNKHTWKKKKTLHNLMKVSPCAVERYNIISLMTTALTTHCSHLPAAIVWPQSAATISAEHPLPSTALTSAPWSSSSCSPATSPE